MRAQDAAQYDDDYFFREQAIVVPVLITNDIDGAACETRANKMPMMVNVRKSEGDGVTCGFARKLRVRPILRCSIVDLLFYRGDEPWSATRPGIIHIVPTRYANVDEFKGAHLSRYMRLKLKMPKKKKPHKPYTKKNKPRKPYTKKDPVKYALQQGANRRGFRKY